MEHKSEYTRQCEWVDEFRASRSDHDPLWLDGFGNHKFERAPRVCCSVYIGADSAVDVGRGVFLVGRVAFVVNHDGSWTWRNDQYRSIHRNDEKEPTERMRATFYDAAALMLPEVPSRAAVMALAVESQANADDRAREAMETTFADNRRAVLRVAERIESGDTHSVESAPKAVTS